MELREVALRPIGTSLPLGYLAFALGMIVLVADSLGWIKNEQLLVGVLLASYVFPLQLIATIMAFLGRDTVGATILGLFTTSWLAFGLLDIVNRPGSTPTVLGLFSISFGVVVAGLAVVASHPRLLFAAVLPLLRRGEAAAAMNGKRDADLQGRQPGRVTPSSA